MSTPAVVLNSANRLEVRTQNATLMYSYKTLVAVVCAKGSFRSDVNYSRTTEKHLSQFGMKDAPRISQADLEALV